MSLGGVRDEAEIRGHRRTYIGSMPGKVIQGMKKAKSSNPLFLLDEVDKLGADWRGDPSSALLEVLDPEQNNTFNDHYLEVDYDLSDVMFVHHGQHAAHAAAAARPHGGHPHPRLHRGREGRDREAPPDLPKQMKEHGLKKGEWSISDEALRDLIRYYTREAGVRNLERELAKPDPQGGQGDRSVGKGESATVAVTRRNLEKFAGVPRYPPTARRSRWRTWSV